MADLGSGARFGRYRLRGRVAAGGMGEVYKAIAQGFDGVEKLVAIKLIRGSLASEPELIRMFVEEAKLAFLLSHANLVQTFDVGTIDGQYFIAMELVEGRTLAHLLQECRDALGQLLPHRHAIYVVAEACRGLHYAHRAKDAHGTPLGIVHRDVSPSNILLSRDGEVKVSDFGIAWSTLKAHQSELGAIKGKVPYMPPEQMRGGVLDARADVYSLGAVLYEAICGRAPFVGPPGALIPLVVQGRFPPPHEVSQEVPEDLEAIVLRAMALSPEDRYDSAAALRDALEELAMQRSWRLSSTDLAAFAEALDQAPNDRSSEAGAFDLALGQELCKVAGEGELSIFTSAVPASPSAPPTPAAPAPVAPEPSAVLPPAPRVETDTVAPRRRATPLVLYGLAVIAVAIGAGLIARSSPGPDRDPVVTRGADAGGRAPPAPLALPPAPPGAAPSLPLGITPPTGAPVPAPATQAADDAPTMAVLAINTEPWTHVEIDGARVGTTPVLGRRVRPGRHTVRLTNPARGITRTVSVTLRAGERRRIVLDLSARGGP